MKGVIFGPEEGARKKDTRGGNRSFCIRASRESKRASRVKKNATARFLTRSVARDSRGTRKKTMKKDERGTAERKMKIGDRGSGGRMTSAER